VYEFIVKCEICYYILQLYVRTFFLYSPMMAISIAETCSCRYSLQYTLCWWTIYFIVCKSKGLKISFYAYTNRRDAMLLFMINPVTNVNSRTSLKQITEKITIKIHKLQFWIW